MDRRNPDRGYEGDRGGDRDRGRDRDRDRDRDRYRDRGYRDRDYRDRDRGDRQVGGYPASDAPPYDPRPPTRPTTTYIPPNYHDSRLPDRYSTQTPRGHLPPHMRGEYRQTTEPRGRYGGLPTPWAPQAPRAHPNRPPRCERSLSPSRVPDYAAHGDGPRSERSPKRPASPGRKRKFGDPFLKADKNRKRLPIGSGIYKDIEDMWAADGDAPTKAAEIIRYFVEALQNHLLLPKISTP